MWEDTNSGDKAYHQEFSEYMDNIQDARTAYDMINDYRNGYYVGTVGLFTFPSWPIKAAIALGATLAAVQLLAMAVQALGSAMRPDSEPRT